MAITNTLVSLGNYEYYEKFTTDFSPGGGQDTTTWVCPSGVRSVQYLVVAGGGGGGSGYFGGGGGAGGLLQGTLTVTPGTSYTIKIGSGGLGGIKTDNPYTCPAGSAGSASQFDTLTVNGGGYGAGGKRSTGGNGGCGGGSSGTDMNYTGGSGGTGSPGYNGGYNSQSYSAGGGGSGMGGVGSNGVSASYTSAGGAGLAWSITGSSGTYSRGGDGHYHKWGGAAAAGASNTGNGGGGAGHADMANGANGGSGIVILRYAESKMLVRGGREWLL